jgi:hypothetical protein
MELKNLMHKNSTTIILNRLKEKRNWFLVSFTIMLITVVILPIAMGNGIDEENIVLGMVEIFFLVYINCMIDFSYLHDPRKLSYNISKPITDIQKINITIIVNVIFTAVLVAFLGIISALIDSSYIAEMFLITIPWLLAGIFTAALSSILTGNTVAAGFATIINFTLPLLVLAIINYFFQIVQDIAVGFNSNILFNNFVENIYRIDILYFVKYMDEDFDFTYLLVLAGVLIFLYGLILIMSKRRKHERAGELVVMDGYKSVISILVAALAPAVFSVLFYNTDFTGRMISFVLLSALAFYLINAILEKSFRINQFAVKLFIGFIVFFLLFIVVSDVTTEKFEKKVPLAVDVSSVYISQNTWVYSMEKKEGMQVYSADEQFIEESDSVLFSSPGSIQSIINMHKEIVKDQYYYYDMNFVIVYFMKDGSSLYRYYDLDYDEEYKGEKDRFITNFVNGQEFKEKRLKFVYDDEYYNDLNITDVEVTYEDENYNSKVVDLGLGDVDIDILRMNMQKDYDDYLSSCGSCMNMAVNVFTNDYNFDDYYYKDRNDRIVPSQSIIETEMVEKEDSYSINLITENDNYTNYDFKNKDVYLRIYRNMGNTFNYIDGLNK